MWFDFAGNTNLACCLDKLRVGVGKCANKDGVRGSEWSVVESLMSASCNIFCVRCADAGNHSVSAPAPVHVCPRLTSCITCMLCESLAATER